MKCEVILNKMEVRFFIIIKFFGIFIFKNDM